MKFLTCVFLFFFFGCKGQKKSIENNEFGEKVAPLNVNQHCSNLILNNTSKVNVSFYYYDRYQDLVQIKLKPYESYVVAENSAIFLKQSNLFQNFYLLYPCDSINITVNALGNAILRVQGDSIRNNELDLSRRMNENTSLNFWHLSELRGKYFDSDYKKYDSSLLKDFNEKILFLEKFVKQNQVSASYISFVKNYLRTLLLDSETYIGMASKGKIETTYREYLDKAAEESRNIFEKDSGLIFFFQPLTYSRYKLNNISRQKLFQDTLYSHSMNSLVGLSKQKALFLIAKDEVLATHSDTKWFVRDFIDNTTDSLYKNYILDNINLKSFSEKAPTSDTLVNINGDKFSFSEILEKAKGNVLYFDFWASWCAPCRAEMAESQKNVKYFSGKSIQFIYLSQDENTAQWKKAVNAEKLSGYSGSYLLQNPKVSILLKKLKVTTIPRYIIYGKDGLLLNSNAPRPSDPQLIPLLEKLLADGK